MSSIHGPTTNSELPVDRVHAAATARSVTALYDELWDQAPPRNRWSDRSIRYAATVGWAVPMAWDDNIDTPDALPDLGQVTGKPWQKVHLEDIEWLVSDGSTLDQIADRLRVVRSTIEHHCARAGRYDLLERMIRNKTVQEHAA